MCFIVFTVTICKKDIVQNYKLFHMVDTYPIIFCFLQHMNEFDLPGNDSGGLGNDTVTGGTDGDHDDCKGDEYNRDDRRGGRCNFM